MTGANPLLGLDLSGKIAIVTGGGNGIGQATASALAIRGATVVVADIDDAAGKAVVAELGGAPHRFEHLDVGNDGNWEAVIASVRAAYGRLDIMFLNAGIRLRGAGGPARLPALDVLTLEAFRHVTRINGDGVTTGAILGYPLMRDSGGGVIVVNGSTAAISHTPGDPAYAYAKAGLIGFVRSIAPEFAEIGIRICMVSPGSTDTRIYPGDIRAELASKGVTLASPKYLANAVLVAIASAKPADLWFARGDDEGFFTFCPSLLPSSPARADEALGRRFVPASPDGSQVAGEPVA